MKVLMFSDSLGSLTTTFIKNEVEYFAQRGQLAYMAGRIDQEVDGLDAFELQYAPGLIRSKLQWYLWKLDLACNFVDPVFGKKASAGIADLNPDIVHCHFGYEALKLLQNVKTNVPVLVHFHGYDASQMLLKKSYIRALQAVWRQHDVWPIVVSDAMKIALQNAGVDMSKAFTLRYGIDLTRFVPPSSAKKSDKKVFLQVSSLAEKKGHTYSLEAIAKASQLEGELLSNAVFIFTGDGPEKRKLEARAQNLKISHLVQFIGAKQPSEVIDLLAEADYFMHHSITAGNGDQEGIPNAIMEAMAMELPILSTYHSGIPELVAHGTNGLLCREKDVENFARQIIEICEWKRLPMNRKMIEARYNLSLHLAQLETIYASLLS